MKFDVPSITRRDVLASSAAAGVGAIASNLVPHGHIASAGERAGHHAAKAKHVIVLYMSGGFSHVDTFDPKPRLIREHDVSIGPELTAAVSSQPKVERFLKAPLWQFRRNKKCGTEVSDLFPHMRDMMHEVALIRSMHCDHRDHGEATLQLHTGSTGFAMPSLGAWLS
ncbi:MAG: DUF1501 domain-containing protein [Planctomycetota bacterium]|nr:DUF1501 domain-containing protein [Planctomycetota bacterium]